MNNLKLIVITRPQFFEGETALVKAMFGQGLKRLHLRKPQATEEELADQGIKPNTIRLSIGIENVNDLIAALDDAFKAVL